MKNGLAWSIAVLAIASACREDEGGTENTEVELDFELLEEIKADWANQDLYELGAELMEDARGCMIPRWWYVPVYGYNPDTYESDGIHLQDQSYPIDTYDENRPRIVTFQMEEDGTYTQVGLEWYFEPPEREPLEEHPQLFGVPMDGMMEPHIPDVQYVHYDIHAWLWDYTSEENDHGYFGLFNKGMTPPSWWAEYEPVVFDGFKFFDPTVRSDLGYVAGDCVDGLGIRHTNAAQAGQPIDHFTPNHVYTDVNGIWLGAEWSVPDDGTGAPTLFGQPMLGPDTEGNYYLRSWAGARINPEGFFHETHPLVSCAEPPIPTECM